MPNDLDYVDWLSMESLRRLKNALAISQFFNTDYNSEFTKEFPIGEILRVPFPLEFIPTHSLVYDPQPIIDRAATVTVDKVSAVHFEWDSAELALKMPRGQERISQKILKPAMDTIAQDIETQCSLWALENTPNIVGQLGTNPTTWDQVFGAASERMKQIGSPAGEKGAILSPGIGRTLKAAAVSYFNPASQISQMFKEGSLGRAQGYDTYESVSLHTHTAGTWAGTVEMAVASLTGATTLSLTATTGDTFKKNDRFNIAGVYDVNAKTRRSTGVLKQFVVTADVTAAASAATISFLPAIVGPGSPYQNVSALPAAGADLTLFPGTTSPNGKTGTIGFALGKNAFALVGVKLANPKQAEMSSYARDPETGLSVSFLRMFDPVQRKWINRFDVLYGFGNLYNDHDAVAILGA